MISEGADPNEGLLLAVKLKNIYLTEYLIFKGADNIDEALKLAMKNLAMLYQHRRADQRLSKIEKYLRFKIANPDAELLDADPNAGLIDAVKKYDLYKVKHYVAKGADNLNEALALSESLKPMDHYSVVAKDIENFLRSKVPKPPPKARKSRR